MSVRKNRYVLPSLVGLFGIALIATGEFYSEYWESYFEESAANAENDWVKLVALQEERRFELQGYLLRLVGLAGVMGGITYANNQRKENEASEHLLRISRR